MLVNASTRYTFQIFKIPKIGVYQSYKEYINNMKFKTELLNTSSNFFDI